MTTRLDQLKQLLTVTWDGNLISKDDTKSLYETGLIDRAYGWNWITKVGVKTLRDLGEIKP